MSAIEISADEVREALGRVLAEKLSGVNLDALVEEQLAARIGVVSFTKAAEMLQLRGKNPERSFREFARKYGVPVIHFGKAAFVKTERIEKLLQEHELKLLPIRRTERLVAA